jgi:hypothetical protein
MKVYHEGKADEKKSYYLVLNQNSGTPEQEQQRISCDENIFNLSQEWSFGEEVSLPEIGVYAIGNNIYIKASMTV